jgi:ElaB/YqjD/DUF883 family membrane-anchored ribosome-binding protein
MLFAAALVLPPGGTMTPTQPQFNETAGNDIRDYAEETDALANARQQLSEVMDGLSERARDYGRYADEQVQQNPWTAVGIGFGVGMVMGALLTLVARRD